MTDLDTKLSQIDNDQQLNYVLERSEVNTDKDGYVNSGVGKQMFYKWSRETRAYLNKLALALKLETALKAKLVLKAATKAAAEMKVSGLRSGKEHIQQATATEILDRMLGKPVQKREVDLEVKKPVTITHILKREEEEDE